MKKIITLAFLSLLFSGFVFSQNMHVKEFNYSTFREDKKLVTPSLINLSSPSAKEHPEFGVLPFNSQCSDCVELIDERTLNTRQFIEPNKPGHTYSQSSYFPLHYQKDSSDILRTIDPRLRPTNTPGVYAALNQPVPTVCDLNKKLTSLTEGELTFEFNKDLRMFYMRDSSAFSKPLQGNYSNHTIGEEGLRVLNLWDGINLEQQFRAGEIKTSYVIPSPLSLPFNDGWLVIEDHFSLPEGYYIEQENISKNTDKGYQGNYVVKNSSGETMIVIEKPIYIDVKAWGMHGYYKLLKDDNNYSLQVLVPFEWLTNKDNTFPLTIDPIVWGNTKLGNFRSTGLGSANLGFTSMALGSCNTNMTVTAIPGKSQLTNCYLDVEYTLTYDNMCGNPPLQAPFCTYSQVTMEVYNPTCNTTTGLLACNPAQPPYTGTCTTDSALVPAARAILINSFRPNYLSCIPPQCPDYNLPFTLKNRDSICLDVCGYLCARGNMWQMTIEACRVEGNITQDKTQICAGEPVTFTAHPTCGVPPYHYIWSWTDDGNTINYDTIYNTADYILSPNTDILALECYVIDTCGIRDTTNMLSVDVVPSPSADAGNDIRTCNGGPFTLGGNPTTTGTSVAWTGENATVQSWLNATNIANPTLNIPSAFSDTTFFVVRCSDFTCFRTDTVWVYTLPKPSPLIDTSGSTNICSNQSVTLNVTEPFSVYAWNTGGTGSSITVSQPGNYYVIAANQFGCRDTSNIITVSNINAGNLNVFPDTLIILGDSVTLYSDLNLNSSQIDSFWWYPDRYISCTNCTHPVVSPTENQYYSLIVNTLGCVLSDSVLIQLILPNNFFIPNAFTPNGDGNNDVFFPKFQSGVEILLFQVFNRWGEKVHEGNYPWDGNYKSKPAPQGTYVYLFKIGLYGEDLSTFRTGSVTLIR